MYVARHKDGPAPSRCVNVQLSIHWAVEAKFSLHASLNESRTRLCLVVSRLVHVEWWTFADGVVPDAFQETASDDAKGDEDDTKGEANTSIGHFPEMTVT